MSATEYMTLEDIAGRVGIKVESARIYHRRAVRNRREGDPRPGDLPEPDRRFGVTPVWLPETIDAWLQRRPGKGVGGGYHAHKS